MRKTRQRTAPQEAKIVNVVTFRASQELIDEINYFCRVFKVERSGFIRDCIWYSLERIGTKSQNADND